MLNLKLQLHLKTLVFSNNYTFFTISKVKNITNLLSYLAHQIAEYLTNTTWLGFRVKLQVSKTLRLLTNGCFEVTVDPTY